MSLESLARAIEAAPAPVERSWTPYRAHLKALIDRGYKVKAAVDFIADHEKLTPEQAGKFYSAARQWNLKGGSK